MNLLRIRQYIQRIIHVYLLTTPGKYRQKKLRILKELFEETADFLNNAGQAYWLDFGTLLGYHREQGIIPHDIDIDFAMKDTSYQMVLGKQHLLPSKIKFYDTSFRHHGPKLYLNYKGFDADIYFYEETKEGFRSYEKTRFENERQFIPGRLIFPLKNARLFDRNVTVPCQTKDYLEYIYGYIGKGGVRNMDTGFWEKQ